MTKKRRANWMDRVGRFLISGKESCRFTTTSEKTAQQTAWRLRSKHPSLMEAYARGKQVVLRRRVR